MPREHRVSRATTRHRRRALVARRDCRRRAVAIAATGDGLGREGGAAGAGLWSLRPPGWAARAGRPRPGAQRPSGGDDSPPRFDAAVGEGDFAEAADGDGLASRDSSVRLAVSVPLSFVGTTAAAPERVPTTGLPGVWSVVSVKVGRLVAARLVRPDESRVVLTVGPPATMRVRVKGLSTSVSLSRAWFEDLLPHMPVECVSHASWGRWGTVDLGGATVAVLEVPPGERRCVFLETSTGEVVAVRAPTRAGATTTELKLTGSSWPLHVSE